MRGLVEKKKATQRKKSSNSTKSGNVVIGRSSKVNPIFRLQRMIGNQAVQRFLQPEVEDNKKITITNPILRFTNGSIAYCYTQQHSLKFSQNGKSMLPMIDTDRRKVVMRMS